MANNVEATYNAFLDRFRDQFADHTKQQCVQVTLESFKYNFPYIDQYISNFETLAIDAGYTIGSPETMTLFMKGLSNNREFLAKVIDRLLGNYYQLKETAIAVTKSMQLVNAMMRGTYRPPIVNNRPWSAPRPQYNSSTAPRHMNNILVPIDLD